MWRPRVTAASLWVLLYGWSIFWVWGSSSSSSSSRAWAWSTGGSTWFRQGRTLKGSEGAGMVTFVKSSSPHLYPLHQPRWALNSYIPDDDSSERGRDVHQTVRPNRPLARPRHRPGHPHLSPDDRRHSIPQPASSTSRRDWLARVLAVATGTTSPLLGEGPSSQWFAPSPVAWAALPTVVTTKAVCDPTVSVWKVQGGDRERILYLLGTAHISDVSAALARQLVQDVHPGAVFVELDLKRIMGGLARSPPSTSSSPAGLPLPQVDGDDSTIALTSRIIIPKVLPPGSSIETSSSPDNSASLMPPPEKPGFRQRMLNFGAAAVGNALKGMYKSLDQAGFRPGEEFVAAMEEGQKQGAAIVLGDRDVDVTLRRLTQALAVTDLNELLDPDSALEQSMRELLSASGSESMSLPAADATDSAAMKQELAAFVETMKNRQRVTQIMAQLREIAPELVQAMLTERDAYMAAGLDTLNQFDCIVAVMGLAHLDGVESNLRNRGWQSVPLQCK